MSKLIWGTLTQPPPHLPDTPYGVPANVQPALFEPADETHLTSEAALGTDEDPPLPEPLPAYMAALFEVAGVPDGLACGQSLAWLNAAHTSARYEVAEVRAATDGEWVEFALRWSTGRAQLLRVDRYLELRALQDSMGLDGREPVTAAAGRLLVDFRTATGELLLRH